MSKMMFKVLVLHMLLLHFFMLSDSPWCFYLNHEFALFHPCVASLSLPGK